MTLEISPDLAQLVQQQMATGQYESENDLIFSALNLLAERQRQLDEIRREVDPAIESLDRGEGDVLDMDRVRQRVRERIEEARN
jgi:antitoxin ParD1/3/4